MPTAATSATDERQTAFEKRLRGQVEAIVSSVVGPNHARVQVAADFDFNRITQTSDKFDPEGRVVRSSQTREETSATNDGKENQVTVGNEIPGGQRQPAPGADNAAARDESRKSEEIVNYEISKTTKTEVIEGGRVNRISVAVLVDGTYGKNDKGESTYQPRSKEELDQIATLVRSAIGFNQKRGDQVEIVNLRFAETQATPITEPSGWLSAFQFTKDDIMRAIEMVVMGLLGFVVMLHGGAAAGAPHHHARRARRAGAAAGWRVRWQSAGRSEPRPAPGHLKRRPAEARNQSNIEDDRPCPGPGPGPRPVGAKGRRDRRQKSKRNGFHHPPMAA